MLNEGNQMHNFISNSVINYGFGSATVKGYGSYGSGSATMLVDHGSLTSDQGLLTKVADQGPDLYRSVFHPSCYCRSGSRNYN
jgi:hypothetical protein